MTTQRKYTSIYELEQKFPDLCADAKRAVAARTAMERRIIIVAPVKSGKRILVEAITKYTYADKNFYVTALNRKDVKPQFEELKAEGVANCFVASKSDELLSAVKELSDRGERCIIHFDESDYGTGDSQRFSKTFYTLSEMPNVTLVCYSATNEEALFSSYGASAYLINHIPPSTYRGASYFLDNDLVHEASPFWSPLSNTLTDQGMECVNRLSSSQPFGVVRLTEDFGVHSAPSSMFRNTLADMGVMCVPIDKDNAFDWETGWKEHLIHAKSRDMKFIYMICQTAGRSTELPYEFKQRLAFWHSHRSLSSTYNTITQDAGRPFHFHVDTSVSGPTPHIYSRLDAFRLQAGKITYTEYKGNLSGRVDGGSTQEVIKEYVKEYFDREPSTKDVEAAFAKHDVNMNMVVTALKRPKGDRWFKQQTLNSSDGIAYNYAAFVQPESKSFGGLRPGEVVNILHLNAPPDYDEIRKRFDLKFANKSMIQRKQLVQAEINKRVESWKYVVKNGLIGKYVLAIPVERTVDTVVSPQTKNSMYG